ncbi:MAG: hypothetical protein A4S16_05660 [Proteobacteria bacterium SG_bin6]|nr:MAG: hypothetical protein A4S16_05660 [Proteobacteria bacterium SG_bin6]
MGNPDHAVPVDHEHRRDRHDPPAAIMVTRHVDPRRFDLPGDSGVYQHREPYRQQIARADIAQEHGIVSYFRAEGGGRAVSFGGDEHQPRSARGRREIGNLDAAIMAPMAPNDDDRDGPLIEQLSERYQPMRMIGQTESRHWLTGARGLEAGAGMFQAVDKLFDRRNKFGAYTYQAPGDDSQLLGQRGVEADR